MPRIAPVLALLLALSLSQGTPAAAAPPAYFPRAPELRIQEWVNTRTRLSDLRGKVVLLEFFQIVCPPCETARPQIAALHARYRDQGFEVVGVASAFQDLANQTPEKIRAHVAAHPYPYPVGIDAANEAEEGELPELRRSFDIYGATASPYAFLIDRQGRIRGSGIWDAEAAENFLKVLLAE